MAEQFRSITEARKDLPSLATTVEGGSDRVVITNQGKPQAVLLGYDDFKGLLAAVELMNRPGDLAQLKKGLADKERISFDELRRRVAAGRVEPSGPVEDEHSAALDKSNYADWIGNRLDTMDGRLRLLLKQLKKVAPAAGRNSIGTSLDEAAGRVASRPHRYTQGTQRAGTRAESAAKTAMRQRSFGQAVK